MNSEYRFRNARNQFASLKDSLLNNLDFSDSNFSRHVTRLVSTEKKMKLLALYVSMTNFFQDFVHHREGLHNSHGFLLEDEDKMRKEITEAGGSVQGLIEFVEMVDENYAIRRILGCRGNTPAFHSKDSERKILR